MYILYDSIGVFNHLVSETMREMPEMGMYQRSLLLIFLKKVKVYFIALPVHFLGFFLLYKFQTTLCFKGIFFFPLAELQNGNSCPSRNIIQYKDFRNERSKELKLIVFRAHVKIATGILLGLN